MAQRLIERELENKELSWWEKKSINHCKFL